MNDSGTLQTYYTLLAVDEVATASEVRKAYLRRAAECHPDKHPEDEGATERFQALGEAYECLKDPIARKEYDLKLDQTRQSNSRSSTESPPRHYHPDDHYPEYHHYRQPSEPYPPHLPHSHHGHTFFRASGFSPFPPFPRPFQHAHSGGLPAPLAMFVELMAGFPSHRGPRLGPAMFNLPFGPEKRQGPPSQDPFGLVDPFPALFLQQPFNGPGAAPHPPLFRQRPLPTPRHHHPYPFPQGPGPILRHPTPVPVIRNHHFGGPLPGSQPPRPCHPPGRCHRATFEIKDPSGRTTGYVQHSTMSWGPGSR